VLGKGLFDAGCLQLETNCRRHEPDAAKRRDTVASEPKAKKEALAAERMCIRNVMHSVRRPDAGDTAFSL
jgi:hypothetical protein